MRARLSIVLVIALSVVACTPGSSPDATTTTLYSTTVPPAPTTTRPLVAGCGEGGDFVEGGGEIGSIASPGSDSTAIGAISWTAATSCETFTVSFTTSEGAPPTTPPSVTARYVDGSPIVRVHMDVEATVIIDQLVETALVERLYVVRGLDGGMFIDLHLAAPAQARIESSTSPAALHVDLQPGIVEYPVVPAANGLIVLTSPLDGATVDGEVAVEGYARTFEATVLLIVTSGTDVQVEDSTTAADWLETWGEFRETMTLEPGAYSLFVGEESPGDGSLEGVSVDLTVP